MNAMIEEVVLLVGVFGLVAWLGWLGARWAGERARERERRTALIEGELVRFADASELVEFMSSEEGRAWLQLGASVHRSRVGLLSLVLGGILGCALGSGLLANAVRLRGAADPNLVFAREDAAWWGTVVLALGIGSVLAAAVMARLGKAWGLLASVGDPR